MNGSSLGGRALERALGCALGRSEKQAFLAFSECLNAENFKPDFFEKKIECIFSIFSSRTISRLKFVKSLFN